MDFDGIMCSDKPGHDISGDEFYDACRKKGWEKGYTRNWQVGAGYRGTC
jgi:hypothetical protein